MYLKKIRLQNIKCFEDVTLEFPHHDGDYSGWNVILGENGRGKSTILRSIAVGVLNPFIAFFAAIEQQEGRFVRQGAQGPSKVKADLTFHDAELDKSGGPNRPYHRLLTFSSEGNPALEQSMLHPINLENTIPHALCYGYGPFRRLEGASRTIASTLQFPQPLSRFVTLFTG